MAKDIDIILWIAGTWITLGIFAIKVGWGMMFSGLGKKGYVLFILIYVLLFLLASNFLRIILPWLQPLIGKGSYLHLVMAGMTVGWGIFLITKKGELPEAGLTNTIFMSIPRDKAIILSSPAPLCGPSLQHSLILLLPCPVCVISIVFSTWALQSATGWNGTIVALILGAGFSLISLMPRLIVRVAQISVSSPNLGLIMLAIGTYFIVSIFVPAKVEEAKHIYEIFLVENQTIIITEAVKTLLIVSLPFFGGLFLSKR